MYILHKIVYILLLNKDMCGLKSVKNAHLCTYLVPLHLQPCLDIFWYPLVLPALFQLENSYMWKKIQWGYFLTSVHMFSSSSPALCPLTERPTCCYCSLLWSLGDVRRPEFVGHSDDSEHLAARLLSAHQNKHRRVHSSPPTKSPVHLWLRLRD